MTPKGSPESQEIEMLRTQLALREGLLAVSEQHSSARIADLERQLRYATEALEETSCASAAWRNPAGSYLPTPNYQENAVINALRSCHIEQIGLSIEVIERIMSFLKAPNSTNADLIHEAERVVERLKKVHQTRFLNGSVMPSPDSIVVEVHRAGERVGYHPFPDVKEAEGWVNAQETMDDVFSCYPVYKLHDGEIISQLWTELETMKNGEREAEKRAASMIEKLSKAALGHRQAVSDHVKMQVAEPA